jgi:hypothetical protein
MKRLIILLLPAIAWLTACHRAEQISAADAKLMADTAKFTTIQWQDTVVNFGTAIKGEKIKVTFKFHNAGNQPLIVASVRAGCGCTVPDYTKGAIPPGGEGEVTGAFNTEVATAGEVRKAIFVTTNTRNKTNHTLIFTGLIKEPAK